MRTSETHDQHDQPDQPESPGRKVARLRQELRFALRSLHADEGPGRADEPELFRSARIWHYLRKARGGLSARQVAQAIYGSEGARALNADRRSARMLLLALESRGLVERGPGSTREHCLWLASLTTPLPLDAAVLRALGAKPLCLNEIANQVGNGEMSVLASLRRLTILGVARGHSAIGAPYAWSAENSPFLASAAFFGLPSGLPRGTATSAPVVAPVVPAVAPTAPKASAPPMVPATRPRKAAEEPVVYVGRKGLDPHSLPRVFAALPPPQAVPVTALCVAEKVYGADVAQVRRRAVLAALRSLRILGVVVGSQVTDLWTKRVRGPSEDDEVVLAALSAKPVTEDVVIQTVWPTATADQAAAVVDSLHRLYAMGLAYRVRPGNRMFPMSMRWRLPEGAGCGERVGAP